MEQYHHCMGMRNPPPFSGISSGLVGAVSVFTAKPPAPRSTRVSPSPSGVFSAPAGGPQLASPAGRLVEYALRFKERFAWLSQLPVKKAMLASGRVLRLRLDLIETDCDSGTTHGLLALWTGGKGERGRGRRH